MKIDRNITVSETIRPYGTVKRILDILFSILFFIPLVLLSVIIKVVYLLNRNTDSIFYKQIRIGKDGKEFDIYKFRTMNSNAERELKKLLEDENNKEEWRQFHKLKQDPRITKLGLFLRKSSIDEFPQFINVLKGDMSIVGPRPLVPGELEMHNGDKIYWKLKPGITGWWACNGRSDTPYDERLKQEYYYINNVSFLLDLKIILKTIICIFKKAGAR